MKKNISFIITFMSFFTCCFSQGYAEILNLNTEHAALKMDNIKFKGSRSVANILLPIAMDKLKTRYLLIGANAESINFSEEPNDFSHNRFYGITATLGYIAQVSIKSKITTILLPFTNSDFKINEGNHVRFGGIVRWATTVNEAFTWRVSAGLRQQYFGTQYILLAGIDWKAGENWRIFGDLPQNFTIVYRMSDGLRVGLNHLAGLTSYNISGQSRYFRYNYTYEGLFMEINMTKNIVLKANADYALTRKFEIYNDKDKPDITFIFFQFGNKPIPLSKPLEKGGVFRLGLSYRILN